MHQACHHTATPWEGCCLTAALPNQVRQSETTALTAPVKMDMADGNGPDVVPAGPLPRRATLRTESRWKRIQADLDEEQKVPPPLTPHRSQPQLGSRQPEPLSASTPARRSFRDLKRPANPWKSLIKDTSDAAPAHRSAGTLSPPGTVAKDDDRDSVLGTVATGGLGEKQATVAVDEVCAEESDDSEDESDFKITNRRLVVVCAEGLRNADRIFGGKSDPYAVIFWDGRRVGQTKVVKDDLNPTWRAAFELDDIEVQQVRAS